MVNTNSPQSPWFICPRPNPGAAVRLYCFPYAGGGIPVFRGWAEALPLAEVWAASLPGRGSRLRESPLTNLPELVEQLGLALPMGAPFAFFGHSLGARVAFELGRWLRQQGRPLPIHLFVSAAAAPQLPRHDPPIHGLPWDAFIAALRQRHALAEEVLAHPELLDIVLPTLRVDFALVETTVYSTEPPLNCPITACGGTADSQVTAADLAAWSAQTSAAFRQLTFPGDHLFLHASQSALLEAIGRLLSEAVDER